MVLWYVLIIIKAVIQCNECKQVSGNKLVRSPGQCTERDISFPQPEFLSPNICLAVAGVFS